MFGVILTLPERPDSALRVLAAAGRLAELTGSGRINVLALRAPPVSTIVPSEEVLTTERERRIRDMEHQRTDTLRQIFTGWSHAAPASGLTTEWADIEGLADQLVVEWGQRADFVVLKRPIDRQLDQERRALHAALFDTDRPVLVVPPVPKPVPFGRRVVLAWRDDGRSVKAVLAGLRCAAQAQEVHVLAATQDASQPPRLPDVLHEHGVTAKLHVLPIAGEPSLGETLLRTAHQLGADMLVMGAYAHSPLRELILGGVTRYMLEHADLPVLMRH